MFTKVHNTCNHLAGLRVAILAIPPCAKLNGLLRIGFGWVRTWNWTCVTRGVVQPAARSPGPVVASPPWCADQAPTTKQSPVKGLKFRVREISTAKFLVSPKLQKIQIEKRDLQNRQDLPARSAWIRFDFSTPSPNSTPKPAPSWCRRKHLEL